MKKIEFHTNSDVHQSVRALCLAEKETSDKKYFTIQPKKATIFVIADKGLKLNDVYRYHKHWAKSKQIAKKVIKQVPEFSIELDNYDYSEYEKTASYTNENYTLECDWFDLKFSLNVEVKFEYEEEIGQGDYLNQKVNIENLKVMLEDGELAVEDSDYKKIIKELKNNLYF